MSWLKSSGKKRLEWYVLQDFRTLKTLRFQIVFVCLYHFIVDVQLKLTLKVGIASIYPREY